MTCARPAAGGVAVSVADAGWLGLGSMQAAAYITTVHRYHHQRLSALCYSLVLVPSALVVACLEYYTILQSSTIMVSWIPHITDAPFSVSLS